MPIKMQNHLTDEVNIVKNSLVLILASASVCSCSFDAPPTVDDLSVHIQGNRASLGVSSSEPKKLLKLLQENPSIMEMVHCDDHAMGIESYRISRDSTEKSSIKDNIIQLEIVGVGKEMKGGYCGRIYFGRYFRTPLYTNIVKIRII